MKSGLLKNIAFIYGIKCLKKRAALIKSLSF